MALLRFHRKSGDRPGFQPPDRDRLAGLFAISVGAVIDAAKRLVDFGDQLALAVAGAKLDGAVPAIEAARYLQIENKIRAVVKFDLADAIPLVE